MASRFGRKSSRCGGALPLLGLHLAEGRALQLVLVLVLPVTLETTVMGVAMVMVPTLTWVLCTMMRPQAGLAWVAAALCAQKQEPAPRPDVQALLQLQVDAPVREDAQLPPVGLCRCLLSALAAVVSPGRSAFSVPMTAAASQGRASA